MDYLMYDADVLLVGVTHPMYKELFDQMRKAQQETGVWTEEDEGRYQQAMEVWHALQKPIE